MASSSSLLGLVDQLQGLETQFSLVLMEAAMKIAYFTDINLFLVIENAEGRSWVGRNSLKEEFVTSGLRVGLNDIHYEVDPTVTGLVAQPSLAAQGTSLVSPTPLNVQSNGRKVGIVRDRRLWKRSAGSTFNDDSLSKRARLSDASPEFPRGDHLDDPDTSPQTITIDWVLGEEDAGDGGGRGGANAGGSDVEEIGYDIKPETESASTRDETARLQSTERFASVNELILVSREKLDVIQGFDSIDLTDKSSFIYKLVSSAGYDLAKLLANVCPYQGEYKGPSVNKWMNEMLEEWIQNFPNLIKHKTIIKNLFVGKNFRKARLRVLRKEGYKIDMD